MTYLNMEILKDRWKNKDDFFRQNRNHPMYKRFDELCNIIKELKKVKITINEESSEHFLEYNNFIISHNETTKEGATDADKTWNIGVNGAHWNDIPTGGTKGYSECKQKVHDLIERIEKDKNNIETGKKLFEKVRTLLSVDNKQQEYAVFTASLKSEFESYKYGSGQRHAKYNFVTNNHFFNIIRIIHELSEEKENRDFSNLIAGKNDDINKKKIPLQFGWYNIENRDDKELDEKNLKTRFVLKFLYMWSKKGKVLSLCSLPVFHAFIQSELGKALLEEKNKDLNIIEFNDFIERWKSLSEEIFNRLGVDEKDISDFSKLLSISLIGKSDTKSILEIIKVPNQAVILYGSPGTGKTYEAKRVAAELLELSPVEILDNESDFIKNCQFNFNDDNKKYDQGAWALVQFHPSYSYEDFIGGIKPLVNDSKINNKEQLKFSIEAGKFKKFCDAAKDNINKNFIFIIDEVNRSNLSAVFGELLYCLEYRGNKGQITLPNFKDPFYIPENVYVIGTMNNIDKSLLTFDYALRRRFKFYEHQTDLVVLENILRETRLKKIWEKDDKFQCNEENVFEKAESFERLSPLHDYLLYCFKDKDEIWHDKVDRELKRYFQFIEFNQDDVDDFVDRCEELNKSIIEGLSLDKEYQIGHAYFMQIQHYILDNPSCWKDWFLYRVKEKCHDNLRKMIEEDISGLDDEEIISSEQFKEILSKAGEDDKGILRSIYQLSSLNIEMFRDEIEMSKLPDKVKNKLKSKLSELSTKKNEHGSGLNNQCISHQQFESILEQVDDKTKDILREMPLRPQPIELRITAFEREKLWLYSIEPLLEEYLGRKIKTTGVKKTLDDIMKAFCYKNKETK